MHNLLIFSLQATFYIYGALGFLISLRYFLAETEDFSIFLISSFVSFTVGYLINYLFYYESLKLKNFFKTIFLSWLLLILISSIPFFSLINVLDLNAIIFISTSLITTTGFNLNILSYIQKYESLLMWSSVIQFTGGFFSIISFILTFLVLFNKQNNLIVFNKKLMFKFICYYFMLFILYVLLLNIAVEDNLNSIVIASAIISTGGIIGKYGNVLGYYFSDKNYLLIYSMLIMVTLIIVPFFLYIHNNKIIKIYYLKFFKRSLLLFTILSLPLLFLLNNVFNFQESLFIFLSFFSTTGLLPNKVENFLVLQKLYPLFFLFLIVIIIGGFAGSSSGGLKIDRSSIVFIKIKDELTKLTLSHKVYGVDIIKKGSNQRELNSFFALVSFGVFIVIFSVLMFCAFGYSLFEAFCICFAALTNTGDGFLFINNIKLEESSIILFVLNFLMICGRFELVGYLLIFYKFFSKH